MEVNNCPTRDDSFEKNIECPKFQLPRIEEIGFKKIENRTEIERQLSDSVCDGKKIVFTSTHNKQINDHNLQRLNNDPDTTVLHGFYQTQNQILPYSWFFLILNLSTKQTHLTMFVIDTITESETEYQICLDSVNRELNQSQLHYINDHFFQP